jgi:hypothetical protein
MSLYSPQDLQMTPAGDRLCTAMRMASTGWVPAEDMSCIIRVQGALPV